MAFVELSWTYSPPDYFEDAIDISSSGHMLRIDGGKVTANIAADEFDSSLGLRERLHGAVEDRFQSRQVSKHGPYRLSKPCESRVHPDGRRDYFVDVEPIELKIICPDGDVRIEDEHGNVTYDSKLRRVEIEEQRATRFGTYQADPTLRALRKSYHAAVDDPADELTHLYEVWEALKTRFGGQNEALLALKIDDDLRPRLGLLSNNEPLQQGRHRGKFAGELRDATQQELVEARGIARAMIDAYLGHLDE